MSRKMTSNAVPISLSKGKVAMVDAADAPRLWRWRWSAARRPNGRWYAVRSYRMGGKSVQVMMHREILGPGCDDIDHRDRDGLNNTRANLRPATRSLNNGNAAPQVGRSSRYKGVRWYKQTRRWTARVGQLHVGYFHDEVDAALAYDMAAIETFGAFARPNFLRP